MKEAGSKSFMLYDSVPRTSGKGKIPGTENRSVVAKGPGAEEALGDRGVPGIFQGAEAVLGCTGEGSTRQSAFVKELYDNQNRFSCM